MQLDLEGETIGYNPQEIEIHVQGVYSLNLYVNSVTNTLERGTLITGNELEDFEKDLELTIHVHLNDWCSHD